jgi:hypothetical protein
MKMISGIPNNNSLILDAANYLGKDAIIESNDDYSNSTVAVCTIAGGEIFDTGWIPAPTLSGVYELLPVFNTDMLYDISAEIIIYRKDNIGTISRIYTGNRHKLWDGGVEDVTNDFLAYFDGNYEYMIKIVLSDAFVGTYFYLDRLQLIRKGVTNPFYETGFSCGLTDDKTGYKVRMTEFGTLPVYLVDGNSEVDFNFSYTYIFPPEVVTTVIGLLGVGYVKEWYMDSTGMYYTGAKIGVWDFFDISNDTIGVSVSVSGVTTIPVV